MNGLPAVYVAIEASQFPERVEAELVQSLRSREVNHKFHYQSYRQAERWLAIHRAYSPFHTDANCGEVYEQGFEAAAAQIESRNVHVIGLGCGSGHKDAQLIARLTAAGRQVWYSPVDVSVPLVLTAHRTAGRLLPAGHCHPVVCDLGTAENLAELLRSHAPAEAARLVTFFGMLPNFEPARILPRLVNLLVPGDTLLFSANLAPGTDYDAGVRTIAPLYDNALTRAWLLTFLLDLGVEADDGELRFTVESMAPPLKAMVARFHFTRARNLRVSDAVFALGPGDVIRLFFSCRHTPQLVRDLLRDHGLTGTGEWVNPSGEEGVFLGHKRLAS